MPLSTLRQLEDARERYREAKTPEQVRRAAEAVIAAEREHEAAIGVPVVSGRAQRLLPYAMIGFLVIVIVVAVLAAKLSRDTAEQVQPIINSPCQRDPASDDCAAYRLAILKAEPVYVPCSSLARVLTPEALFKYTICVGLREPQALGGKPDGVTIPPNGVRRQTSEPVAPVRPGSGSGGDDDGSVGTPPSSGGANPPQQDDPDDPPEPPAPPPEPPSPPHQSGLQQIGSGAGQIAQGATQTVCNTTEALGIKCP